MSTRSLPTRLRRSALLAAAAAALASLAPTSALAQQQVLNLYSARHYQTDDALYANFTKATGIKINRLDGKEDELVERIRNEGTASPADILITVDAARLEVADKLGLFAPLQSRLLDERIPANLRTPTWAAFSTRARVIVYNKAAIKPAQVQTYADLAKPAMKGQVCVRSGSHPYNLSLGAAVIAHEGEPRPRPGPRAWWPTSPAPQGRRHRPDQGRGRRRMRRDHQQHLLPGAHDAQPPSPTTRPR
jgi:iron(III) transport system substrate-binding protein